MCNAWNHPSNCTCGWGGTGHLGRQTYYSAYSTGSIFPNSNSTASLQYYSYDTFVNPNARCPVCGASVFFYQSEHGSRVFFDELGPPWPKHPCTDSQHTNSVQKLKSEDSIPKHNDTIPKTSFIWQKESWEPFFLHESRIVHNDFLAMTGLYKRSIITLYLKNNESFSKKTPMQLKNIGKYTFDISTFFIRKDQLFIVECRTYDNLQVAHIESIKERSLTLENNKKARAQRKKSSPNNLKKIKLKQPKNFSKPPNSQQHKEKDKFKTAMELAFEKANNH